MLTGIDRKWVKGCFCRADATMTSILQLTDQTLDTTDRDKLEVPVGRQDHSVPTLPRHDDVPVLPFPGDVDLGLSVTLQPHLGLTSLPDNLSKEGRGDLQNNFEISVLQLLNVVGVTIRVLIIICLDIKQFKVNISANPLI